MARVRDDSRDKGRLERQLNALLRELRFQIGVNSLDLPDAGVATVPLWPLPASFLPENQIDRIDEYFQHRRNPAGNPLKRFFAGEHDEDMENTLREDDFLFADQQKRRKLLFEKEQEERRRKDSRELNYPLAKSSWERAMRSMSPGEITAPYPTEESVFQDYLREIESYKQKYGK